MTKRFKSGRGGARENAGAKPGSQHALKPVSQVRSVKKMVTFTTGEWAGIEAGMAEAMEPEFNNFARSRLLLTPDNALGKRRG
jgi:hypothetical protein